MSAIIIAIDGPAASGKSTIARLLAEQHGWTYINTGQMYRAVAYFGLLSNISLPEDEFAAIGIAKSLSFSIEPNTLLVNGEDLSKKLCLPLVEKVVSAYSAIPEIRNILVRTQRDVAKKRSVVMDGRDVGTVVFPKATLKIFLVASADVRAKRRLQDLQTRFSDNLPSYEEILRNLELRDSQDSERSVSPLIKAPDAILIDTSTLSIEETLDQIEELLKRGIL